MLKLLQSRNLPSDDIKYYLDTDMALHKRILENDMIDEAFVAPASLTQYVLHQAYDALGHNSI